MHIIDKYIPGTIGRISEMHADYYSKNWNFGLYFEAKVASELSEFLKRFNTQTDGIWLAVSNGRIEASVIIDGEDAQNEGAHLRWFIVSDNLKGKGIGKQLLKKAVGFCTGKGYQKTYLWTFEGLGAARHIYEAMGFKLVKQQSGIQWGTEVNEQYFVSCTFHP